MNRGFTRTELLIAVTIVGILAAMGGSKLQASYEPSKESSSIGELQLISAKLKAIALENPDALPDDLGTITAKAGLPMVDPWERPDQAMRLFSRPGNENKPRKDRNLRPINTDFDLYSKGPDGKTIIRANDGAFIGKASACDRNAP